MKIAFRKRGYNGHKKLRIKNSAKNIIEVDSELTEIESLSYDEYNFPELEDDQDEMKNSDKNSYQDSQLGDIQTLKDEINGSAQQNN